MIIAVDFDGTLHDWSNIPEGKRMGPPMPGAVNAMWMLHERGHTIIVHTFQGDKPHIHDWLAYFKFPHCTVTNVKPNADAFIDDRAYHFDGDWPKMMRTLSLARIPAA